MSAIAEAMTAAGFQPGADRIRAVAMAALKASPKNWDGAKHELYKRVRNDADLLWAMFEPFRAQAAQRVLTDAAAIVRAEELSRRPIVVKAHAGGGGHIGNDSQPQPAPTPRDTNASGESRRESGGGHFQAENQESRATPARPYSRDAVGAVAAVARLSLLDTFLANGQPIGNLTPDEANRWAGSRERDARFVRMLTANLPPNQPIRKYRTADEAAALYAQAETADAG